MAAIAAAWGRWARRHAEQAINAERMRDGERADWYQLAAYHEARTAASHALDLLGRA